MDKNVKMANGYNDTEKFTRMERLTSDQLHADLPFQKVFNAEIVDLIDFTFDENVLQALDVSFRDGKYNIVDGKHRFSGICRYEERTGNKIEIPALVRYGLTEKDECELFEKLAKQRRKITAMEILESSYSRENEFTVGFVDAIRDAGLLFDFNNSRRNGYIHLTRTPVKIYRELGQTDFKKFLKLFYRTWNGNKYFINEDFLRGLYEFYTYYKNDIDEELFVKRLSLLTEYSVTAKGDKNKAKEIANLIFNKYNKNKRLYPTNRLEEKKYFYMM